MSGIEGVTEERESYVFKCMAIYRPRLGMGSLGGCETCCYKLYDALGRSCKFVKRVALACSVAFTIVLLSSLCRAAAGRRRRHYGIRPTGQRRVLRGRVASCTTTVGMLLTCCRVRSS